YTKEITNIGNNFTVTNTHKVNLTEINVTKVWNDSNDQDGIRPKNVTIQLLADGVKVNETVLNADKGWNYIFSNLPVYKEGQKIAYTIVELDIAGYILKRLQILVIISLLLTLIKLILLKLTLLKSGTMKMIMIISDLIM
uniref:Cna B-type domain-containing protein n=1 Tax=uncultured Methanobrevibacter sp. TaxID=253161 RepID=UPI0025E36D3D